MIADYRVYANVAMVNGLIAIALSFVSPLLAFIILFTRPLMKKITDWIILRKANRRTSKRQRPRASPPSPTQLTREG